MLLIVESPSKAKTITTILSKIKGDTKYVVKASVGHIRSLSKANKNSKGDRLEISGIDISHDFLPIFEIDDAKKGVVSELKKLAKESKDGILFATDCDREGEAISWHLAEVLGVPKDKVKRLEFHEITENAILNAIKTLARWTSTWLPLSKLVKFWTNWLVSNFHQFCGKFWGIITCPLVVCSRQLSV